MLTFNSGGKQALFEVNGVTYRLSTKIPSNQPTPQGWTADTVVQGQKEIFCSVQSGVKALGLLSQLWQVDVVSIDVRTNTGHYDFVSLHMLAMYAGEYVVCQQYEPNTTELVKRSASHIDIHLHQLPTRTPIVTFSVLEWEDPQNYHQSALKRIEHELGDDFEGYEEYDDGKTLALYFKEKQVMAYPVRGMFVSQVLGFSHEVGTWRFGDKFLPTSFCLIPEITNICPNFNELKARAGAILQEEKIEWEKAKIREEIHNQLKKRSCLPENSVVIFDDTHVSYFLVPSIHKGNMEVRIPELLFGKVVGKQFCHMHDFWLSTAPLRSNNGLRDLIIIKVDEEGNEKDRGKYFPPRETR